MAAARAPRALAWALTGALAGAGVLLNVAAAQGVATAEPSLAEQVQRTVGAHLVLPGMPQARVAIEVGTLDPRLKLAPCKRVEPQFGANAPRLWGATRIALRCVEGEKNWQVWLPVTVRVFAPALVAARALPAGTVLAAEDLKAAEIDWAAVPRAAYAQREALIGRTLARGLDAGTAPRLGDIRLRQWFAAGETVAVLARGDGFAVAADAVALGPGLEGQPVRLRTEAGRVLTGTPVGERRAEVAL